MIGGIINERSYWRIKYDCYCRSCNCALLLFSTLIWPSLKANIERNTQCAQSYGCSGDNGKTQNCFYLDEKGDEKPVVCPSDK